MNHLNLFPKHSKENLPSVWHFWVELSKIDESNAIFPLL